MEILSLLIPAMLVTLFFFFLFVGKLRGKIEKESNALLGFQCGGMFGWTSLCTPLVRHTMYDDYLIIGYGSTRHIIKYEDIDFVSKSLSLLTENLRYHHNNQELPKRIIIYTNNASDILSILKLKHVDIKSKAL